MCSHVWVLATCLFYSFYVFHNFYICVSLEENTKKYGKNRIKYKDRGRSVLFYFLWDTVAPLR